MWYFTWILGVLLACSLGIINVLRLEAQEALAKEKVAVDPLTQLLAKESVLERLHEKIDNSKRNGMPFSLLYISVTDFKLKHQLEEHEMDTTLLNVVASIKTDIRIGLDIAARVGEEDFLLALPGATFERAEITANRIQRNILVNVKTPVKKLPVEIGIGFAEYAHDAEIISEEVMMGMSEVEALLNITIGKCFQSTQV
jgi:cyd operon protein YbgT